jgi:hypothetical protein
MLKLFSYSTTGREVMDLVRKDSERGGTKDISREICCKVAVNFLALYAVKFSMFCSNDCLSAEMVIDSLQSVECSA